MTDTSSRTCRLCGASERPCLNKSLSLAHRIIQIFQVDLSKRCRREENSLKVKGHRYQTRPVQGNLKLEEKRGNLMVVVAREGQPMRMNPKVEESKFSDTGKRAYGSV